MFCCTRVESEFKGGSCLKRLCCLLLTMFLFSALTPAQEFRSTISGHIIDSSGAAVPNATIQAVNVDTNETTTATSDASGAYTVPFLRPGNYKLTASSA